MDYFLRINAIPIDFYEDDKEIRVIAILDHRLYRLQRNKESTVAQCVIFTIKWTDIIPIFSTDSEDSEGEDE